MGDVSVLISQLMSFFTMLHLPNLHINPLDVVIVAVVLFYAHEGYGLGFTLACLDLASFVLSFIAALKFYSSFAKLLIYLFSMPLGFANALGFFIVAFVSEILLNILFRKVLQYVPAFPPNSTFYRTFKRIDKFLGLIPGMISAFIVLSFILTIIVSLPSSPLIKGMVTGSNLGEVLIANTSLFESKLNDIFGGALHDTLNFMTVEPKSNELVTLHFKTADVKPDPTAEQEMFQMVNKERIANGVQPLVFDNALRDVGREHSRDMFLRGYFSHYTPEGLSPFDRMTNAGISFNAAGENLALAPSTDLAMQGLMNSPGHRKNILDPNFNKVGIGVMDGGIYGMMYSQEFTD